MSETKQKDDRETGETTRHADSTHAPVVKTWPLNIISTPTTLLGCWRSCCWADFVQRQSRSAVYAGAHPRPNIGFRLFFSFSFRLFFLTHSDWGAGSLQFFFSSLSSLLLSSCSFCILKGIVSYIAPCLYINTAVTFSLGEPTLIFKLIPRAHSLYGAQQQLQQSISLRRSQEFLVYPTITQHIGQGLSRPTPCHCMHFRWAWAVYDDNHVV